MTGLIVSGHGQFAEGMTSSLELIAGKQENYEVVNFTGGSTEDYTNDLKAAVNKLSDCGNIVVLTDITGGTPFQMSVMLMQEYPNIRVVGGINVGLLIEVSMMRAIEDDVDALLDTVVANSKEAMSIFKMPEAKKEVEETDGI